MNCLHSVLLTDGPEGEHCVRTTTYYAYMLFKSHRNRNAVRVETTDSDSLAISVSASRKDNEVVVTLVNPRGDADMEVECNLPGVSVKQASAQILHDNDLNAYNGFEGPERVAIKEHRATPEGAKVRLDLPRLSVATVTIQIA
jgi:alpha-N-arabinofuranosidase